MGEPFSHSLRVRYAECDMQGVVFNAHYLAYLDASITELWRTAFGGYDAMLARGVDMVVAETRLRFLQAAKFDDELQLTVAIAQLGTTSIVSDHRILRDRQLLVEATLRHVIVDRVKLEKTPIPGWMREGLGPWMS